MRRSVKARLKGFSSCSRGQTAVEYLLTTVMLVTVFAGMYGFLQGQLKRLFILAGTKILMTYY
jgi:hypothetical protein